MTADQVGEVAPVPVPTRSASSAAARPSPWGASAAVLAVATTVGHALSYAFSLVMSRALGPADYGALGALLGIAVVAAVPATALQTQVARVAAVNPGSPAVHRGYRLGWLIGGTLAVGLAVLAVPLGQLLRLDSAVGVLLLGLGLVPVSALGARQGVLLGRGAFVLLAAASVLVPALRLVGGAVAAALGTGVSGAVGLQTAATWVGLAGVAGLVRLLPRATTVGDEETAPTAISLLAAASGLLGLFVLANLDVLLARVFLSDTESGLYAVAALGAKVVFWGSQFVALLVFPRVARGEGSRHLVLRAGSLVAVVGLTAAAAGMPLAAPTLAVLVGPAYAQAAPFVPWFVLLGTLLALVQLFTYAAVAADRHRFSVLLWSAVVGQTLLVALVAHGGIGQILAVFLVGSGMLAAAAAYAVVRASRS